MHRIGFVFDVEFFASDTAHAIGRNLRLRDTHDVFVRHAYRKMTCDFLEEFSLRANDVIDLDDGPEAVEVKPAVGNILIADQAPYAFKTGRLCHDWKCASHFVLDQCRRCGIISFFLWALRSMDIPPCNSKAGPETA